MVGQGVGDSEKIVIWGCYLIEFGKFSPQKRNLPSSLRKYLPSGEYILYITTDFLDSEIFHSEIWWTLGAIEQNWFCKRYVYQLLYARVLLSG